MNFALLKKHLPKTPGVYLMKSRAGRILYVGKAANLRRRVMSYFEHPQDRRIGRMLQSVAKVDFKKTNSVIEALMLEAQLIKAHQPRYNILEKDDKSFLRVVFTREKFSRVIVCREAEAVSYHKPLANFGPFTSGSSLRAALKELRRIFPWSDHVKYLNIEVFKYKSPKPCFYYSIGLCAGTCANAITQEDYRANIKNLIMIFRGKSNALCRSLKYEMRAAAAELNFEKAADIKKKIDAFTHIQDVALLKREHEGAADNALRRVEGYDISNIGSSFAVGSMVVFTNGIADPKEYRKFKIKTVQGQNDSAMLREIITRRFQHDWQKPDLILVDGGLPQVNASRSALSALQVTIPVIGIAKGPERKRNDFLYPPELHKTIAENRDMLVRVRDSAHKFAVKYHRELRNRL